MAIQSGEIIEQDLKDIPNPSVLIHGYARENKPLHVAVGIDDAKLTQHISQHLHFRKMTIKQGRGVG